MRKFFILIGILLSFNGFASEATDDNTGRDDVQVYHIFGEVDLVSTIKFRYGIKPKTFVKSVFPQIESEEEDENYMLFNEAIKNQVQALIDRFREHALANSKTNEANINKNNSLYIDYNSSFLKSGSTPILSIRFTLQSNFAGLPRRINEHVALNFNLKEGEEIQLADLFIPDSNYLETIAIYCNQTLKHHLEKTDRVDEGTAPKLENYTVWNLKPNGLLITFEENQVAPHIYGSQTVLIPYTVLNDLISKESIIYSCIKHRSQCLQSNVLTGGFIDTA